MSVHSIIHQNSNQGNQYSLHVRFNPFVTIIHISSSIQSTVTSNHLFSRWRYKSNSIAQYISQVTELTMTEGEKTKKAPRELPINITINSNNDTTTSRGKGGKEKKQSLAAQQYEERSIIDLSSAPPAMADFSPSPSSSSLSTTNWGNMVTTHTVMMHHSCLIAALLISKTSMNSMDVIISQSRDMNWLRKDLSFNSQQSLIYFT